MRTASITCDLGWWQGTSLSAIFLSIFALLAGGVLGGFATWRYFYVIENLEVTIRDGPLRSSIVGHCAENHCVGRMKSSCPTRWGPW